MLIGGEDGGGMLINSPLELHYLVRGDARSGSVIFDVLLCLHGSRAIIRPSNSEPTQLYEYIAASKQ